MNWQPRDTVRARELRNTATPAERRLWRALSANKIGGFKFSRQMPVGPFYADFLCRRTKLIVEVDGFSHDLSLARDQRRDEFLKQSGYHALRFTNEEVMGNLDGVVGRIARWLEERPTPDPSRKREGRW